MSINPATADQLLEMSTLQIKRMKIADQEQVQAAIENKSHPFWALFEKAVETLVVKAVSAIPSILKLLKKVTGKEVATKKTSECFTDKLRYYYRDPSLDTLLPEEQPAQEVGEFSVYQTTKPATFKEMAESFLQTTGDHALLSRLIKERGMTTKLPAIESLIERQEVGEHVGLRTDGYGNFFFVENKEGEVSVVHVLRYVSRWGVYVRSLGDDYRWRDGHRLFARNQTL